MKPSVTLSESTPTSPQKYPTSLRNRCLCVVLFFEANKLQKKWSKTNTAREQDVPLAILQVKLRIAAMKALSTAVLHIIELKASTKYTLMSIWLLNAYFETRRQNSDFTCITAASLTSEKTVEVHGVASCEVCTPCSQKLLSQGTDIAFFVDTCACLKALCIFMVFYQRENSCHGHCSNLDTSSDCLVKNSNTTMPI